MEMGEGKFKVAVFDIDGTLALVSSFHFFLRKNGFAEEAVLEFSRCASDMDVERLISRITTVIAGKNEADLLGAFNELPKMSGIKETVDSLHAEGIKAVVATSGSRLVAEMFKKEYGFDYAIGAETEVQNGVLTGKAGILTPERKRDEVAAYCLLEGIRPEQVVVIGNSRSDTPLFDWAGYGIGLNPDRYLSSKMKEFIFTTDLREICGRIHNAHREIKLLPEKCVSRG